MDACNKKTVAKFTVVLEDICSKLKKAKTEDEVTDILNDLVYTSTSLNRKLAE